VNEAEVDHAQLLDVFDVDRPTTELVGNERHKLHDVVHLQQNITRAISNNVGRVFLQLLLCSLGEFPQYLETTFWKVCCILYSILRVCLSPN